MATVLTVTNQKGGVGKTTTICALCGVFAAHKKKVLAIDLDPQGNMTFSLGAKDDGITIHNVITGKADIKDAIQHTSNNCDVISSNILLSGSELELTNVGREYILKEKLEPIMGDYDYILLDTPPALSILTINAYIAASDLIIPMTPEILSLQGIAQLRDTIVAVKKYYNKELNLRGILLTKYNPRYLLTREVEDLVEIVAKQLDSQILKTKIGTSISAAEAPAHQQTLAIYDPDSRASVDYFSLAEELYGLKRTKQKKKTEK
ncbi:MAG TPA: ParA family protein [Oscillospiraceae bacterium]|nr:ParA family protein [Oscillospiraceae bacterium]